MEQPIFSSPDSSDPPVELKQDTFSQISTVPIPANSSEESQIAPTSDTQTQFSSPKKLNNELYSTTSPSNTVTTPAETNHRNSTGMRGYPIKCGEKLNNTAMSMPEGGNQSISRGELNNFRNSSFGESTVISREQLNNYRNSMPAGLGGTASSLNDSNWTNSNTDFSREEFKNLRNISLTAGHANSMQNLNNHRNSLPTGSGTKSYQTKNCNVNNSGMDSAGGESTNLRSCPNSSGSQSNAKVELSNSCGSSTANVILADDSKELNHESTAPLLGGNAVSTEKELNNLLSSPVAVVNLPQSSEELDNPLSAPLLGENAVTAQEELNSFISTTDVDVNLPQSTEEIKDPDTTAASNLLNLSTESDSRHRYPTPGKNLPNGSAELDNVNGSLATGANLSNSSAKSSAVHGSPAAGSNLPNYSAELNNLLSPSTESANLLHSRTESNSFLSSSTADLNMLTSAPKLNDLSSALIGEALPSPSVLEANNLHGSPAVGTILPSSSPESNFPKSPAAGAKPNYSPESNDLLGSPAAGANQLNYSPESNNLDCSTPRVGNTVISQGLNCPFSPEPVHPLSTSKELNNRNSPPAGVNVASFLEQFSSIRSSQAGEYPTYPLEVPISPRSALVCADILMPREELSNLHGVPPYAGQNSVKSLEKGSKPRSSLPAGANNLSSLPAGGNSLRSSLPAGGNLADSLEKANTFSSPELNNGLSSTPKGRKLAHSQEKLYQGCSTSEGGDATNSPVHPATSPKELNNPPNASSEIVVNLGHSAGEGNLDQTPDSPTACEGILGSRSFCIDDGANSPENSQSPLEREQKEQQQKDDHEAFSVVLSKYEVTMALYIQKIEELEEKLKNAESEKLEVIQERDTAWEDLRNVECAFSDVHKKYERVKGILENNRKNEEILKERDNEMLKKIASRDEKIQELKEKVKENLEQMHATYERKQKSLETDVARLRAQLRKTEMKIDTLEQDVEQKTKEAVKLSLLCDELINGKLK